MINQELLEKVTDRFDKSKYKKYNDYDVGCYALYESKTNKRLRIKIPKSKKNSHEHHKFSYIIFPTGSVIGSTRNLNDMYKSLKCFRKIINEYSKHLYYHDNGLKQIYFNMIIDNQESKSDLNNLLSLFDI